MCRLAAYLGPPLALARLIAEPSHSLAVQAYAPRELRYARLNADGYGIGWFDGEGRAATYLYPGAIWADVNLDALGRSLSQPLWIGFVRSATPGNPVHVANTQPFSHDDLLFVHNGYIGDFHARVRAPLTRRLEPPQLALIRGNSDSEHLFALLRQHLAEDPELALEQALVETCADVAKWIGPPPDRPSCLLNLILSEGRRIYALRHAIDHDCPSLYYCTDHEGYPDGQLVASEPLDEIGLWQPVPEQHLLILDPDEPPELRPL